MLPRLLPYWLASQQSVPRNMRLCRGFFEADARTRTADPFITSEVLYQLSYVGGPAECSRG